MRWKYDFKRILRKNSRQISSGDALFDAYRNAPLHLKGKTVYFTFDDGPSDQTLRILDILDEHQVKASFFVCVDDSRAALLNTITERGHDVGIHSASHVYQNIYAGFSEWRSDFDAVYRFVAETTGIPPKFYRFPGGSYGCNPAFLRGNRDQFSRAVAYIHSFDMEYIDWNVCADDGNSSLSKEEIISRYFGYSVGFNALTGKDAIVLAHDRSDMSASVDVLSFLLGKVLSSGAVVEKLSIHNPVCQSHLHVWLK